MKKSALLMAAVAFVALAFSAGPAKAVTYTLAEGAFYRNAFQGPIHWAQDYEFDFTELNMHISYNTPGQHTAVVYLDAEIDETLNTFFNETGTAHNALAAGQSWQIGDPFGDFPSIYDNTVAGVLTNSDLNGGSPNDVSMALGWNFTLGESQVADLNFIMSGVRPTSGFYLEQFDPDSQESLFFSSNLTIEGGGPAPVPEPSTIFLLGIGLASLGIYRRRRSHR